MVSEVLELVSEVLGLVSDDLGMVSEVLGLVGLVFEVLSLVSRFWGWQRRLNDKVYRRGSRIHAPELTPRSPAPSKRREAPSAAAAAAAAVAVVVAAAVAKFLVWSRLLGTGQLCPRDCPARF